MKLVIDTNLFVSGIFWGGNPYKLLKYWINDKFELIVTTEILDEYYRVINEISYKDKQLANEWLIFISKNIKIIKNVINLRICRDEHDNKFINCAISGNADYLITGDKDLLDLAEVNNIRIMKVKHFLDIIVQNGR